MGTHRLGSISVGIVMVFGAAIAHVEGQATSSAQPTGNAQTPAAAQQGGTANQQRQRNPNAGRQAVPNPQQQGNPNLQQGNPQLGGQANPNLPQQTNPNFNPQAPGNQFGQGNLGQSPNFGGNWPQGFQGGQGFTPEQIWQQIGNLHRQAIYLELGGTANPLTGQLSPVQNSTQAGTTPNAAGQAGNVQTPGANQAVPQQNPSAGFAQGNPLGLSDIGLTDRLWMQIANLHAQIVRIQASDSDGPKTSFIPQQGEDDTPDRRIVSRAQRARERSGTTVDDDSSDSNVEQLWQQIAELQAQIVEIEVRQIQSSPGGFPQVQPADPAARQPANQQPLNEQQRLRARSRTSDGTARDAFPRQRPEGQNPNSSRPNLDLNDSQPRDSEPQSGTDGNTQNPG